MGSGYRGYINTKGAKNRFKPHELMDELRNSGVKYSVNDVILVTRNYNGKLLWLEKGKGGEHGSGFKHIIERHQNDFDPEINILDLLMRILQSRPLKHFSRERGRRLELADVFLYELDAKIYLVAYGENGYIVSFYPYGKG